MRRHIVSHLALVAALLVGLTGCDGFSLASGDTTQVVARVNGSEISMLQFSHALERVGVEAPNSAVRKEVANKLVERELALQQALEAKLDRRPEVMLRLEEARRDVLARAWAEQVASQGEQPSPDAAARYFAEHPALFAERRIYRLREAAIAADVPQLGAARQRFARGASMAEVSAWLREQKVAFNEQVVIRAAEQLPIAALPRLATATEGETVFFESPRGIIVYQVISAQPAPVGWAAALPVIVDYLAKQAGKRAVEAEMRRLRSSGEIAYRGDFAALLQTAGTERR